MRILKQRIIGTVVATLIAAICGILAGYWCGRGIILHHRQERLALFALRVRTAIEDSSGEARTVLDQLNASPHPRCSEADISFLRVALFRSAFLKDAGRMHDGTIGCSASFGRVNQADKRFQPTFIRPDGIRIYRDIPPFRVNGLTMVAIQRGDAYVLYNPYNLKSLQTSSMHFAISDRGAAAGQVRHLGGEIPKIDSSLLTADGSARTGDSLYTTRCSLRYSACVTTYVSISEALQAEYAELSGYLLLGGLFGGLMGGACFLLYQRNRSTEQQLRRAIRCGALQLVYQPIFDLQTRRIVGAEALARWTDEGGHEICPERFIRIAENGGFVGDITRLVTHRAVSDLKTLLTDWPDFRVNVNITAADLVDPAFFPMLESTLETEGVGAENLGIEVTESSTAHHEMAQVAILQLHNNGHMVHIDDFGTGYSSLSYLQDLAVDVIKIDKAFTHSIGTDSVKVSIVPQIFSMASALHLQVIVEGIETEEQARYFTALSQQPVFAQGWLLGRPVPLGDLLLVLQENSQMLLQAALEAYSLSRDERALPSASTRSAVEELDSMRAVD